MSAVRHFLNPDSEPTAARTNPPIEYGDQPGPSTATAVIVCHGMGQQVRFQTLNDVVQLLRDEAERRNDSLTDVSTRLVLFRDSNGVCIDQLGRAEVTVGEAKGPGRAVHFYEAYWAPLTEGKVTASDVLWFLFRAGWNGVSGSIRGFRRLMFQEWIELKETSATLLLFLFALAVTISLVAINSVLGILIAANTLTRGAAAAAWPSPPTIGAITRDIAIAEIAGLPLAMIVGLLHLHRTWFLRRNRTTGRRWRLPRPIAVLLTLWTWIALSATIGTAVLLGIHLLLPRTVPVTGSVTRIQFITVAGVAFLLSYVIKTFLIQYVGDVVVYLSGYAVSRFNDIRKEIQDIGIQVGRAVYGLSQYDSVIILGHSLGSVVAYDLYNRLVNEAGGRWRVQQRTKLLLTFGSPLDKTAFVFRTQETREADVREALAAAVQPIIVDAANRPGKWVNIWSPADWISGALNYYERPGERYVENVIDREATIPLVAHTQYWKNLELASRLYEALD